MKSFLKGFGQWKGYLRAQKELRWEGGSRVKNTSWAYTIENFTLILMVFRKRKNSKYFSRYRKKRPAKIGENDHFRGSK